jgi:hypothetical protein
MRLTIVEGKGLVNRLTPGIWSRLVGQIRGDGAFVERSTRYLVEARRNARHVTAA